MIISALETQNGDIVLEVLKDSYLSDPDKTRSSLRFMALLVEARSVRLLAIVVSILVERNDLETLAVLFHHLAEWSDSKTFLDLREACKQIKALRRF